MRNQEKVIKIAIYDGKLQRGVTYSEGEVNIDTLTDYYLTDLNYLIPVAYKVYDYMIYIGLFNEKILLSDVLRRLNKDRHGCYQALFDEVYTAITILENQ